MILFTDEQFYALAPYEEYFRTALYSQYIRGLSRQQIDDISKHYKAAGGTTQVNASCSVCIYEFVREVADPWFAKRLEIDNRPVPVAEEPAVAEPKKATTAKKKTAKK